MRELDARELASWPRTIDKWQILPPPEGGYVVPRSADGQVTQEYRSGIKRMVLVDPDTRPYMFDPTTKQRIPLSDAKASSAGSHLAPTVELMQRIISAPAAPTQMPLQPGATVPLVQQDSHYVLPSQPQLQSSQPTASNNLKLFFAIGNSSLIVSAKYHDLKQVKAGENTYLVLVRVKLTNEDAIELNSQPNTTLLIGVDERQKVYRVDLSEVIGFEIDKFEVKVVRLLEEMQPI